MSEPMGGFGNEGLTSPDAGATFPANTDESTAGTPYDQGQQQPQAVEGQQGASGEHASGDATGSGKQLPAGWQKILEPIPSQFHPIVTPTLKEWDRNYSAMAEKYSRYKQFDEQGIEPQRLDAALNLYGLLNTNPAEVYRRLGEALQQQGVIQQQAQAPGAGQQVNAGDVNGAGQQEDEAYDSGIEDSGHPLEAQYRELQQQFQQMQQYIVQQQQAQQQEALTQQYSQQIDAEIQQIRQANPNVDVADLMTRFLAQGQRGEEPSVQKAYEEQQAFIQRISAGMKPPPPRVLSPGGGMPSNMEEMPLNTQEERLAAAKAMIRSLNQ